MENFIQSLGNNFVTKDGENNGASLKSAQLIGIYFSAHWCPPCRNFTPVLAEFYEKVNANGKVFEIVFVSSDRNETSFKDYLSTMPWIAISFGSAEIQDLKNKYQVTGIPKLVVLNPDGSIVTADARNQVATLKTEAWLKWVKN